MIKALLSITLILLVTTTHAQDVPSVPVGTDYQLELIVSGLDNPLFVTHAGDGSGRLFALEQTGYILVIEDGDYLFDPFLDVSGLLSNDVFQGGYTERGLLGLAFHPDYVNNGVMFVQHTDVNGDSVIARYTVDPANPNRVDDASRVEILTIPQLFYDHNGGHLDFGPDGYLYIAVGDGGSFGDNPGVTAQDLALLLGKILRIDVNHDTYALPADNPFVDDPDARPEIWAYGLRNPWRFSFDALTGDLYIGDVGQMDYEEINFQPAASLGGANYGWFFTEGLHPYQRDAIPDDIDITMPVAEYPHMIGCSVTGGYVYRGAALPELNGVYLFGDYCNGRTWSLFRDADQRWRVQPFMETGLVISSFGEDENGELLLVDYKGDIYRLIHADAE